METLLLSTLVGFSPRVCELFVFSWARPTSRAFSFFLLRVLRAMPATRATKKTVYERRGCERADNSQALGRSKMVLTKKLLVIILSFKRLIKTFKFLGSTHFSRFTIFAAMNTELSIVR